MIKEDFPEMNKILLSIMSSRESFAFLEPIDWKGMGLVDYPDIVKKPMDLGTIKNKIETKEYESAEEISNDIRLVWTNCMLYNPKGSEVGKLSSLIEHLSSLHGPCHNQRLL
jgi:hypothetical protein